MTPNRSVDLNTNRFVKWQSKCRIIDVSILSFVYMLFKAINNFFDAFMHFPHNIIIIPQMFDGYCIIKQISY